MFNAFIRKANNAGNGGKKLSVGDLLTLTLRNDGNGGTVLCLGGRVFSGDKYASKKNPVTVTCELTTKAGAASSEDFLVTDGGDGGVHGITDAAAVKALIAELKSVKAVAIK